jgi:hypothetical protein
MRTQITHICDCGKTFNIDNARPLVAVTILQVSIKNHAENCELTGGKDVK